LRILRKSDTQLGKIAFERDRRSQLRQGAQCAKATPSTPWPRKRNSVDHVWPLSPRWAVDRPLTPKQRTRFLAGVALSLSANFCREHVQQYAGTLRASKNGGRQWPKICPKRPRFLPKSLPRKNFPPCACA